MLIPSVVKPKLPALYSTDGERDPMVYLKFFNPVGRGTWYLTEFNPEDNLAFGYADIGSPEMGYFSITEMEEIILPMGLKIERDLSFKPCRLSKVKEVMA